MQQIEAGTKLQVAIFVEVGQKLNFDMIASYKEGIDESSFLMSAPLKDGKAFDIDENTKLMLQYTMGSETLIIAAYKDDEVKLGVRRFWKMRRVSEQRQFFQRADERYKMALHCEFWQETWPLKEGRIEREEALTIDLSAGGAAVYMGMHIDVGELIKFELPRVGNSPDGQALESVASVCWTREAPKGSPYKNIYGLQYKFADDADKDVMRLYIDNLRKVYKL